MKDVGTRDGMKDLGSRNEGFEYQGWRMWVPGMEDVGTRDGMEHEGTRGGRFGYQGWRMRVPERMEDEGSRGGGCGSCSAEAPSVPASCVIFTSSMRFQAEI